MNASISAVEVEIGKTERNDRDRRLFVEMKTEFIVTLIVICCNAGGGH